ncbi:Cardiolipin synthase [Gemmatirosa kalamazoonensis]|uniref:Cardiolipin synthase n=1 Tax=Gemmatirosa kalamazoonensis TaxID=861299 RepID=W0RDZ9_9BACT|nr:cardiolipin synthase [Gemmatirosa kalamazoonensis]AHG89309.1 Cardiolipin synthase [Gemmatirosa kalamazoonensis]
MTQTPWTVIATIAYALEWLIIVAALFVVPRNRRPGSATAWLMLVLLVPYVGLVLFWLIGSPKLSRRRRAQQRTIDGVIAREMARRDETAERIFDPPVSARHEPIVRLAERLGGLPACAGNTVTLLPDYGGALAQMVAAIDSARRFVHVEFYIMTLDATTEPFVAALERAHRRGVAVRVLFDHVGARKWPGHRALRRRLTASGIAWHLMLPLRPFSNEWNRPDLRNHRKILVVDGAMGFTGSMNVIDESYLVRRNRRLGVRYVELVAFVSGPVVLELNAAFVADWFAETGVMLDPDGDPDADVTPPMTGRALCQVLPSGSAYETFNNLRVFVALIHAARRRVTIACPYFVPDESLMMAITTAAQRGVDVTLFSSEVADQFFVHHAKLSFYEELLVAGVKVYQYRAPKLLHAKHIGIDDDIAVIGSSNLDMRSLTLNLEVTLLCYDAEVVEGLRRVEESYLRESTRVELNTWRRRPLAAQLFDNLARLTASLQ